MGIPYTHGRWTVKEGREQEFLDRWEEFGRVAVGVGATGIRLLQDTEEPSLFYSFGSWSDPAQITAFKDSPEFQHHVAGMQDLVESFEPLRCESRFAVGEMG